MLSLSKHAGQRSVTQYLVFSLCLCASVVAFLFLVATRELPRIGSGAHNGSGVSAGQGGPRHGREMEHRELA